MSIGKRFETDGPPPPLTRNRISYVGWTITIVTVTLLIVLAVSNFLLFQDNPYNDLVTFLILPGFLVMGIVLILIGVLKEWRRRHKKEPGRYPSLPIIDINVTWQRRRIIAGLILLVMFFGISSVGVYQAYHFTETPVFCGEICHTVMHPEYTAYQHSPHAKVACTECHIGSGAEWYVKAKISGLYQVYAVVTGDYHLPIDTPVANLRPARATCEECHWPEKFSGSLEREIWRFAHDQVNTPYRYNMLMRVGGGSPVHGEVTGIHWHVSSGVKIRYWARDKDRLDIPWVEVTHEGSEPVVYTMPLAAKTPPEDAEIRTMDCIDCHNRPSHIYHPPEDLVDEAMGNRVLDVSLPYLKRNATNLMEQKYPDTETALETIRTSLENEYADLMKSPRGRELVESNIERLQMLYQRNFFPEQGVRWSVYPDHIGHHRFPGCARCHNDKHEADDGQTISNDCTLCHEMLNQEQGEAAYGKVTYGHEEYRHPMDMPDIWRDQLCTDCHGPEAVPEATEVAQGGRE